jgi:hypothetical protein
MKVVIKRNYAGHYWVFMDGWWVGDLGRWENMGRHDASSGEWLYSPNEGCGYGASTKGELVEQLRKDARTKYTRDHVAYEKERFGSSPAYAEFWLSNWSN